MLSIIEMNRRNYFVYYHFFVTNWLTIIRFWFLLLLSCQRQFISENISKGNNSLSNCTWKPTKHLKSLISYDIWLVNGHPTSGSNSFIDFDHQFSFEQQVHGICFLNNINKLLILKLFV